MREAYTDTHTDAAIVDTDQQPDLSKDSNILVELQEVSRHYVDGDVMALDRVSLVIGRGEFVSIVGPSGCGKSTLLNMIGALDRPTSGSIQFDGHPIDDAMNLDQLRSKQIGFVFQSFHLLPNLTAEENVQLPMFGDGRSVVKRRKVARELLTEVGLADRAQHFPWQLSNGQRQRVAIARALANGPALVLADEPTGALDSESGEVVMRMMTEFCRNDQTTLVVVTHDDSIAERSDRVIRLLDGRIVNV
ncbi:ABC transporter ATP-binding protein [Novipirellula artificiosorum]|uniref:Macrolide export ATP-binding/permease protein MacB n=1 Tax=Novipirellula artificiosorum TaxID=2528016 RepID=A0A5C6E0F2_9BACT|nr:ABC transporter ATP-binding protein [Novipirellula artificiosorum]TWU40629.1 Macrolide export ATP-binding/permease protein MacB [Novipirellula artificiosorum]